MNDLAYKRCFEELQKEAGLASLFAQGAAKIGKPVAEIGTDIAKSIKGTFTPSGWKAGLQEVKREPWYGKALFVGGTGATVIPTLRRSEDPETGRHIGLAERGLLAGAQLGAGLSSYQFANKGLMRAMGIGMASSLVTDRAAKTVGRAADNSARFVTGGRRPQLSSVVPPGGSQPAPPVPGSSQSPTGVR